MKPADHVDLRSALQLLINKHCGREVNHALSCLLHDDQDGILRHSYVNASDDLAAYQADRCGRQAVTAQYAWDNLVDETLYVYIEGTPDPWLTIDAGLDKNLRSGKIVLCYGRTGEMEVDPGFRVFVSKRKLET